MLKKTAILFAGIIVFSSWMFAQDGRFTANLNVSALIFRQSEGNGIVLNPTNHAGFLATFQYRIAPHSSLEVNYGRSYDSQKYTSGPLIYRVFADVTEFSGAYVYTARKGKRLRPFALVGGGALFFGPPAAKINDVPTAIGAVRQSQLAVLYGAGVDYRVFGPISLRAQYRGLYYQPPDFKLLFLSVGGKTNLSEPTIGIAFNF